MVWASVPFSQVPLTTPLSRRERGFRRRVFWIGGWREEDNRPPPPGIAPVKSYSLEDRSRPGDASRVCVCRTGPSGIQWLVPLRFLAAAEGCVTDRKECS